MSERHLYGLIVCGGKSTRMGRDKGGLNYHEKEQQYHMYEILEKVCDKVLISCNSKQSEHISGEYNVIPDLHAFENSGPIAALLSAFHKYPDRNFLITGCDYPFITEADVENFLLGTTRSKDAATFYNAAENLYEPLLGWYSYKSADALFQMFDQHNYSLQDYLKSIDAEKYLPTDPTILISADTPEDHVNAKHILKLKQNEN